MPIVCFSLPIDLYSAAAVRGIKVKNQEPRTRNQEPETRIKRAGTRNQGPKTKNFCAPANFCFCAWMWTTSNIALQVPFHSGFEGIKFKNQEPETGNQEPETRNQEPKTKNWKVRTVVLLETSAFVPGCEQPRILYYKFHSRVAVGGIKVKNQEPETINQEPETRNRKTRTEN